MEPDPPPNPSAAEAKPPEPPPEEPQDQPPRPPRRQRSWLGRLFRAGLYLGLIGTVLLAVAAVLLHYYFPGEKIRPLVEKELSRRLRMPVTVGSLDFSLFRGARIAEVRLGETPAVLNVQELRLDYDLTQLVQGNLVINQVLVDRPEVTLVARDGVWNFQPLLELAGPAEPQEPAPPGKEFPGLPPLPLGVDLQRLAVQNIRLDLNQEGTTTAHLDGLSLEMQGQARREGLEVALRVTLRPPARDAQRHNVRFAATEGAGMDFKTRGLLDFRFFTRDLNRVQFTGTFNLEDNEARLGQPLPSPDLAGEIDLQAEVRKQAVKISRLLVHTVHGNRVEIAGEAENILSDPTFRVLLKEATFLIEDLVGWGRPFLPPVKAGGRIRVSGLETTGRMQESRPQEIEMRGGTLRLENVYADHLPTGAWIDGLSGDIQLKNVRLEQNVPQRLKLDLHMTLGAAAMKELTVKGLELQYALTGEGPNLPQVNLSFDTHLNRLEYSAPDLNPIATSLQAKGSLRGNLASGNFDPFQVDYEVGSLLRGRLEARVQDFGRGSAEITQEADVQLAEARSLLPPRILDRVPGLYLSGQAQVKTRVQARLSQEFQPVEGLVNTQLNLKQVDAGLQAPPLVMNGFSAAITFPAQYTSHRGIKIPVIDLKTRFDRLTVLDTWEAVSGETQTRLKLDRFIDPAQPPTTLPISDESHFQIESLQGRNPAVSLGGIDLTTALKADFHPKDIKNITLKGSLGLSRAEALNQVQTGPLKTDFTLHVRDMSLKRTQAEVALMIEKPLTPKPGLFPVGPLTFKTLSRHNLLDGTLEADLILLKSPSLLNLEARGQASDWGQTFDVESQVSRMDLANLWALVPREYRKGLESVRLAGTADVHVQTRGRLPDFQKVSLQSFSLPLTLQAALDLQEGAIVWPEQGLEVQGLGTAVKLDWKNDSAVVEGSVKTAQLQHRALPGKNGINPEFSFRYRLENLNKLTVERHDLAVPNQGLRHSLTGRVEGFKPFIAGEVKPVPAEWVRRLEASFTTENTVRVDEQLLQRAGPAARDIRAEGTMRSRLSLSLDPGRLLQLDGEAGFDHFHLKLPGPLRIENVHGKIPFSKKLWLDPARVPESADGPLGVARKGFFSQLRDFSRYKNILRIDAIQFQDHRVQNLGMDLLFKNNQLMVEKFLFEVLEGSVGGNLFVTQREHGPALHFSTQFAGLNFGGLVGRTRAAGEVESEMDGTLEFDFQVQRGAAEETISIDQIEANLAITRIGADTLDRVLLFLDPEESKPAIVDTRAKLKLASPHKILVSLRNGNLNVEAWLKNKVFGDILKAPELKRVPVSSLKRFGKISDRLQALSGLDEALKGVAARGLTFDEAGRPRFF